MSESLDLMAYERRRRESLARVLDILHEADRPDLAGELEAKLRDVASGVERARNIWHSISPAQRRALEALGEGRASDFRLATARNLCARDLIACAGGAFDPESKFVITEHGRFVLTHGRPRP
jgi:hypothetical protein